MSSNNIPKRMLANEGMKHFLISQADLKDLSITFMRMHQVGEPHGKSWDFAETALGIKKETLKRWKKLGNDLIETDEGYAERVMMREKMLLDLLYNPLEMAVSEISERLNNEAIRKALSIKELVTVINSMADKYSAVSNLHLQRQKEIAEYNQTMDTLSRLKDIFQKAESRAGDDDSIIDGQTLT